MTYRVELTPRARRDLKNLSVQIQSRLRPHIEGLAENPRPHGIKKLAGEDDTYRIRVGAYRILYQIQDEILLVLVVRIAPRREADR